MKGARANNKRKPKFPSMQQSSSKMSKKAANKKKLLANITSESPTLKRIKKNIKKKSKRVVL